MTLEARLCICIDLDARLFRGFNFEEDWLCGSGHVMPSNRHIFGFQYSCGHLEDPETFDLVKSETMLFYITIIGTSSTLPHIASQSHPVDVT